MVALVFIIIPLLSFVLWLIAIRPYCLKHKQGYTTGANWGVTIWVDWQQAKEMASKNGDGGMIAVCRAYLALHLLWWVVFVSLFFGGG